MPGKTFPTEQAPASPEGLETCEMELFSAPASRQLNAVQIVRMIIQAGSCHIGFYQYHLLNTHCAY